MYISLQATYTSFLSCNKYIIRFIDSSINAELILSTGSPVLVNNISEKAHPWKPSRSCEDDTATAQ